MFQTLKYFITRGYTLFIVSLLIFTFSILKVSAVYYPTDNITNPTCAPGASGCYVSLLPDQTSNAGKFLTTNGTNTSWATVSSSPSLDANSSFVVGGGGTAPQAVYIGVNAGAGVNGSSSQKTNFTSDTTQETMQPMHITQTSLE